MARAYEAHEKCQRDATTTAEQCSPVLNAFIAAEAEYRKQLLAVQQLSSSFEGDVAPDPGAPFADAAGLPGIALERAMFEELQRCRIASECIYAIVAHVSYFPVLRVRIVHQQPTQYFPLIAVAWGIPVSTLHDADKQDKDDDTDNDDDQQVDMVRAGLNGEGQGNEGGP